MIENTSNRDPFLHLLGMMDGVDNYIENMEKTGQDQVVRSEQLPAEGDWDALTDLGFVKGEPVPGDPLFVYGELPEGWTKQATDHHMYTDILDERGVKRANIGYKGAFYDRWARITVLRSPGYEVLSHLMYADETPTSLPDVWSKLSLSEQLDAVRIVGERRAEDEEYVEKSLSVQMDPGNFLQRVERADAVLALIDKANAKG